MSTGASREMRAGVPTIYSSATISPTTSTRLLAKRRMIEVRVGTSLCFKGYILCVCAGHSPLRVALLCKNARENAPITTPAIRLVVVFVVALLAAKALHPHHRSY